MSRVTSEGGEQAGFAERLKLLDHTPSLNSKHRITTGITTLVSGLHYVKDLKGFKILRR